MEKKSVRGILFAGVLAVTSSSFIIRFANQPSYALAFVRVFLTGLVAFFVLNDNYSLTKIEIRDWIKIIIAGSALATHFGWWFDSLNYVPISASLSLTNTAPVWMAIISMGVYREELKIRQYFSIIFVILGSAVLFIQNESFGPNALSGLSLALGSAVGFAIYLLIAKDMVNRLGLWRYFGLVNLVTAVILFIWILINSQYLSLIDPRIWIFGILLALIPGISGHAIYNWSMPKLDSVDVGVATLGEPILGTIFAWIIFREVLSMLQLLGISGLLIAITFSLEIKRRSDMEPKT